MHPPRIEPQFLRCPAYSPVIVPSPILICIRIYCHRHILLFCVNLKMFNCFFNWCVHVHVHVYTHVQVRYNSTVAQYTHTHILFIKTFLLNRTVSFVLQFCLVFLGARPFSLPSFNYLCDCLIVIAITAGLCVSVNMTKGQLLQTRITDLCYALMK